MQLAHSLYPTPALRDVRRWGEGFHRLNLTRCGQMGRVCRSPSYLARTNRLGLSG